MRFGEKLVVFFLRPIYRTFFKRLLEWHFKKVRTSLLLEVNEALSGLSTRVGRIEERLDGNLTGSVMDERFRKLEEASLAQWDGIESLVLALIRLSEQRNANSGQSGFLSQHGMSNGAELDQLNVSHHIR
jgi:hypothetical protein